MLLSSLGEYSLKTGRKLIEEKQKYFDCISLKNYFGGLLLPPDREPTKKINEFLLEFPGFGRTETVMALNF